MTTTTTESHEVCGVWRGGTVPVPCQYPKPCHIHQKPQPSEVCREWVLPADQKGVHYPCLNKLPCADHPVPSPDAPVAGWEEEFDSLTDIDHLIYDNAPMEEVDASLYGTEQYPETQYELSPDKVKDFIRKTLAKATAEARREALQEAEDKIRAKKHLANDPTRIEAFREAEDTIARLASLSKKDPQP